MLVDRYCAVGVESSFGSEATTLNGIRARSVEPSIDRQILYDETIEEFLPVDAVGGPLKVELSLESALRHNQIIPFLVSNMGAYSVTGTEAPYTWDFSLATPRSLSIDVGYNTEAKRFIGCVVNSLEFSFSAREIITVSASIIGKTYKDVSFTEPTYSDESPLAFWQASLSIGGLTVTGTREATLTINRNVSDDEYVLDDFTLYSITPGMTEVSGSLTLTEDEYDELNRLMYGSTTGSTSTFDKSNHSDNPIGNAQIEITASNGTNSVTFSGTAAIYTSGSVGITGRDRIEHSIDFRVISGFTVSVISDYDDTWI